MNKLLIIIFPFVAFLISAQTDSLKCPVNNKDMLLRNISNSFENVIKLPEEKEPQIFGCGTAAHAFYNELSCKKTILLLKKYPFLFDDIRTNEKDEAKFKYLDVLWIQTRGIDDDEQQPLILDEDNVEIYNKWKLKNQYKSIAIAIMQEEINENTAYVQLIILFPRERREVIKKYKLHKTANKWEYELLN